jgi:hypothetical protein
VPSLSIPKVHRVGLAKLQALSDPLASQLLAAVTSAAERKQSAYLSPEDLPQKIEGIPHDQLEEILDGLSGIYHARAHAEVPLEDFVNDVTKSMRSTDNLRFPTDPNAIRNFEQRLTTFMSIATLARAAKGDILVYETERTVYDLRILTDARPIFGDNVEDPPEAIAIMHTLKIVFHRGSEHDEEYFSFDESDLAILKRIVERAELKANSLRAALKKSGMKVLREE